MKKVIISLIVLFLMGGAFSSVALGGALQPDPTSVQAVE